MSRSNHIEDLRIKVAEAGAQADTLLSMLKRTERLWRDAVSDYEMTHARYDKAVEEQKESALRERGGFLL
jgi:hypothetical protein